MVDEFARDHIDEVGGSDESLIPKFERHVSRR
jgi:hypothetical protein